MVAYQYFRELLTQSNTTWVNECSLCARSENLQEIYQANQCLLLYDPEEEGYDSSHSGSI